jgi:lipoprotein-releasing system permease protein
MLSEARRSADGRVDGAFLPTEFVVRGIFDAGYFEYNVAYIATSLGNAQDLYGLGEAVHGVTVMLRDPLAADEVRRGLAKALGPGFLVKTWMEEKGEILEAVAVEKKVMFIVLFFVMIVAAFGITSTLIAFVVQKTREIGVLKALGCTRWQVSWLFLSQSVFVGVVGCFRALRWACWRSGTGMSSDVDEAGDRTEAVSGEHLWLWSTPGPDRGDGCALICGSALVICVIAGVLPAWNAGRLQPVEALRYE